MKAIAIRMHGGLDVLRLEDLPDPEASAGRVVVRVKAVALNHLDIFVREGWAGLKLAFPHVLGADVAGVVEAIGPGVKGVAPGDEVVVNPGVSCGRCRACLSGDDVMCREYSILGEHVSGGYAQKVGVPSQNVVPKPKNLSFDEAACVPLVFLTAWHALVARAGLRAGETVLVHAAGSGVGSAGIQIAKLLGATVIATAGSDAKCERARRLGADHAVNYSRQDFLTEVRRITGKRGVDVLFEHVGKATWEKSLLALARGGRLVTVGATTGYDPPTDLRHVFYRSLSILGSTMGSKGELFDVLALVEQGKLKPVLDRVLPLAEAGAAQKLLEDRAQFGKIVLNP
ncbi:MAG: alcohol dehydrogenase [Anaeromyxobacter sp. RBG_16_69_14]|nr:MAG: alcohol dehydrogenase [Anaeromyxobacter sp. RBG_16_69_14]